MIKKLCVDMPIAVALLVLCGFAIIFVTTNGTPESDSSTDFNSVNSENRARRADTPLEQKLALDVEGIDLRVDIFSNKTSCPGSKCKVCRGGLAKKHGFYINCTEPFNDQTGFADYFKDLSSTCNIPENATLEWVRDNHYNASGKTYLNNCSDVYFTCTQMCMLVLSPKTYCGKYGVPACRNESIYDEPTCECERGLYGLECAQKHEYITECRCTTYQYTFCGEEEWQPCDDYFDDETNLADGQICLNRTESWNCACKETPKTDASHCHSFVTETTVTTSATDAVQQPPAQ